MDTRRRPTEHRLSRRLGMLLFAMLQMVGAVVLPAADGQLDIERFGTPVHVESKGGDDCASHHDHVFCQVVRSTALANPSRATAEVAALATPPALHALRAVEEHRTLSDARSVSASPRAPPSA
jgi:hypothetical protein